MMLLALGAAQALEPLPSTPGSWRALLGVLFVFVLLGLFAWLARTGRLTLGMTRGRASVSVESAVPLGERRSLVVVSVEGRRLLLGMTPMQVSLLTELAPPAPPQDTSFGATLDARFAQDVRS